MEKSLLVVLLVGVALISYGSVSTMFGSQTVGDCTCDSVRDMVAWAEGKLPCVYKDQLGVPTVGIGFNLERWHARETFEQFGLNYDNVLNGSVCLTDDQIYALLDNDLSWATDGAKNCVSSYPSQNGCVQNVLIDMSFNNGGASLCNWPDFVGMLNNRDMAGASNYMQNTEWCGIVGRRCTRNASLVRDC